ncbi:MAG: endonuclease/exonuclease/phosphatase family protein [Anaerolineae bacterium]|nr:endonuclease/exonuclease/phosphatase family protein [Anaerolineae bacterium]
MLRKSLWVGMAALVAACQTGPTPITPQTRIRDIQGSGHVSPMQGRAVQGVGGVVTVVRNTGFWMQDPQPDANNATSEGIYVYVNAPPTVNVGDYVWVNGTVVEFRPGSGSAREANLSITQLAGPGLEMKTLTSGNALPAPIIIGTGGRVPPQKVIDDDAKGDAETTGKFEAEADGLDFYESLEGMLVQVNGAVVVGPTRQFSSGTPNREVYVIGDNGANATGRTARGGLLIAQDDFNPERMVVTNLLTQVPNLNVGDKLTAPIVGVVDYNFGKYQLHASQALQVSATNLPRERTSPAAAGQLAVGCFNVENLAATDAASKFSRLANIIVQNLQAPDLLTLQEVQDNDGSADTSITDAGKTFSMLADAVVAAGGPRYVWRDIDPQAKQDGGEPGGNIRVGFFFRTDRGLKFVDRAGGTATQAVNVLRNSAGKPELSYSPGRIDPGNLAFRNSRKPLVGEFSYNGKTLFVVGNHFVSKGGDQALFGRYQPPVLGSEQARTQQALSVKRFVQAILDIDNNANVIVLGDLNDFEFSPAMRMLMGKDDKTQVLYSLVETLPPEERYTYVYEGNSQVLDHIMLSRNLAQTAAPQYDIVHVNAEYVERASDHDPSVAKLTLGR